MRGSQDRIYSEIKCVIKIWNVGSRKGIWRNESNGRKNKWINEKKNNKKGIQTALLPSDD